MIVRGDGEPERGVLLILLPERLVFLHSGVQLIVIVPLSIELVDRPIRVCQREFEQEFCKTRT